MITYGQQPPRLLYPITKKKLFLQLPVNNKDMAKNFKIKETTHVKSTISNKDHKDLNDAFEAAVNHLAIHGGRVRIRMMLDLVRKA
jgi:hypothetical protein